MAMLTGSNKIKTAVFISGTGSNLKNLIQFSFLNNSPIKIDLVVSSNKKAKGLIFADRYKIRKKIYDLNIKKSERLILKQLEIDKISLICLAGFMRVLSPNFIKMFKGVILNIHPSLLPKYKGLNTHERVIKNKEKYSGCTVHYVNSRLDSGKIILQAKVKISKKETSSSLKKKILKQEHLLYRKAISKVFFSL